MANVELQVPVIISGSEPSATKAFQKVDTVDKVTNLLLRNLGNFDATVTPVAGDAVVYNGSQYAPTTGVQLNLSGTPYTYGKSLRAQGAGEFVDALLAGFQSKASDPVAGDFMDGDMLIQTANNTLCGPKSSINDWEDGSGNILRRPLFMPMGATTYAKLPDIATGFDLNEAENIYCDGVLVGHFNTGLAPAAGNSVAFQAIIGRASVEDNVWLLPESANSNSKLKLSGKGTSTGAINGAGLEYLSQTNVPDISLRGRSNFSQAIAVPATRQFVEFGASAGSSTLTNFPTVTGFTYSGSTKLFTYTGAKATVLVSVHVALAETTGTSTNHGNAKIELAKNGIFAPGPIAFYGAVPGASTGGASGSWILSLATNDTIGVYISGFRPGGSTATWITVADGASIGICPIPQINP